MKRILTFLVAIFMVTLSFGQINPNAPLESDKNVKFGKLENGLTYYIRHNEKPKDRADFYLLTNVGAIQETPAQDGLAHFLEHMALNGTKNLPGKTMLNYFESVGVKFGYNINASTGVEQTMYMLNDIPTRPGIVDTALLIIHDYSGFVTNDPVEIDKERGVIIEEWRTRRNAAWRNHEKSLKYLYGGTKYESCNIIGTKENLETFPASELQDFYKTWYRPDLQAVVIVGDIDPDQILAKLTELFKDIPARENPKPKDVHKIPGNSEPIVGIITDPESTNTSVAAYYKSEPLPREMRTLGVAFMVDLIENGITAMLNERLDDISRQPNAPFIYGMSGKGMLTTTCDAFILNVVSKDGEAIPAYKAIYTEYEKARRYGFTQQEWDRAKANILKRYETAANGASTRTNGQWVNPLIQSFFTGYPYMDPVYEYEQVQQYLHLIPVEAINQTLAASNPKENLVIIYEAPEREGLTHPTEADFIQVMDEVLASEIEAPASEEIATELMDASTLVGSPVKKEKSGKFGETIWTLENGVEVYALPTEYEADRIYYNIIVDGGESQLETEELVNFESNVFMLYSSSSGVSDFPASLLTKMLVGKNVSVTPYINGLTHGINGMSSTKDIETALQLGYLLVTKPRFVEEEYAPSMSQLRAVVPNIMKNPQFVLQQEAVKTLYNNNPRVFSISEEMLDKVSIKEMEKSYKKLFDNMEGMRVYLVGKFKLEEMKPLVEKYFGSLPVDNSNKNEWIDRKVELAEGEVINEFSVEMTTPKSTSVMALHTPIKYTAKNLLVADALTYILNMVYTETVREDEGGTYGVSPYIQVVNEPKSQAILQIQFDTDPQKVDDLVELVKSGLYDIAENGVTPEQLVKVRENYAKVISEDRISNGYWRDVLQKYYEDGVDVDSKFEKLSQKISSKDIKKLAKKLCKSGNLIEILMMPAE